MALSRINGDENLYVSGVFALRKAQTLHDHAITHILSVIDYDLDQTHDLGGQFQHLSIDVNDEEDADLLVHFPRIVRFIDAGLSTPAAGSEKEKEGKEDAKEAPTGGVLVHCAMGKSRSVAATLAYLLWKHPWRFNGGAVQRHVPGHDAVAAALKWVRATRPVAEPNAGFARQLEMWWDMGAPARDDDAVARHPTYRRWLYRREVEESARVGRAPDWIRFEDEEHDEEETAEADAETETKTETQVAAAAAQVRCKKCRRVLTTGRFVIPHAQRQPAARCPHVFVEPLSWMRPVLEAGALEGRLVCPSPKCGASIGRYAWQGFKCSCDAWVCPAFSLQRSKVDEVAAASVAAPARGDGTAPDPRAALGIRMPPSFRKENL